jgi:hypothetical protein
MPFPKVSFSVVPKRLTSSRVSCARAGNSYDSSEMCKQESQRFAFFGKKFELPHENSGWKGK